MILQMKYNELMKARQYFLCIYHVVPYESDKPYVDTSIIKLWKAHNLAHTPWNGISLLSSSLSRTAVSWVQQRATFLLVYPPPPRTSIGMLNSFTILTHSLKTTDEWSFQIVLNNYIFVVFFLVILKWITWMYVTCIQVMKN